MTDHLRGLNLLEWEVLPHYCYWLNQWWEDGLPLMLPGQATHTYRPEQFLITDPERNLYGSAKVDCGAMIGASAAFNRLIYHYTVTDGDDGGPTDLTAWFEEDPIEGWQLIYLIQGFDTNLQPIYDRTNMYDRTTPYLSLPVKED
jgi:hypothetical protein